MQPGEETLLPLCPWGSFSGLWESSSPSLPSVPRRSPNGRERCGTRWFYADLIVDLFFLGLQVPRAPCQASTSWPLS